MIPIHYQSFIKRNFASFIENKPLMDDSLRRYFEGCFKDIGLLVPLPVMWICPYCLGNNPRELTLGSNYDWGDNPHRCGVCGGRTYLIATFQARSGYSGSTFMYACHYLLINRFDIKVLISSSDTKLYDLEIANDLVIETKGSAKFIENIDGSISNLNRPGMKRSDTKKKAFDNGAGWRNNFPNGHFYILTNANPIHLKGHRSEAVTAIYDVTKAKQLLKFINELREIIAKRNHPR